MTTPAGCRSGPAVLPQGVEATAHGQSANHYGRQERAYPITAKAMKTNGELWRFAKLRQVKFLNNIVEQDHRRIKRLVRLGLGFKSFTSASRTIAGYEIMAMIRKG
ncbi:DDE-type integrase/transposase/recombinase [Microvirga sp. 3-52]|uniref:DDE-type integrase/transposase/recombinase n=1 Tax=Microvirga sp. 3-52 TaxID=2792425 RepID=UPI0039088754